MSAMVMLELREDVVGTDSLWEAGERRPVDLATAAAWIDRGVAVPVLPRQSKARLGTDAPERAVILPYAIPEAG